MPIQSFESLIGEMLELQLKDAQEKLGPAAQIGGSLRIVSLSRCGIHEAIGHQIFEDGISKLTLYPELRK